MRAGQGCGVERSGDGLEFGHERVHLGMREAFAGFNRGFAGENIGGLFAQRPTAQSLLAALSANGGFVAGGERFQQFGDQARGRGVFNNRGDGAQQQGSRAEGFTFETQVREQFQRFGAGGDQRGLSGGQFERFGDQQPLGVASGSGLSRGEQAFEEDAFVQRVLINQPHAAFVFHDDVASGGLSDDAEVGGGERAAPFAVRGVAITRRGFLNGGWRGVFGRF